MDKLHNIKGVIFDYGGTLDTNGKHWAEVLWSEYETLNIPIVKEAFKEAYVHAERTLALQPLIKSNHNFYDVLYIKIGLQLSYLKGKELIKISDKQVDEYAVKIADRCYKYVLNTLESTRPVLEKLHRKHNLILVSNFYGNIREILKDFSLLCFFKNIIESSVVGVRKPDPAIFKLGVEALGIEPHEVIVIGDSFSKDILPAHKVGCKTVWLKGEGWDKDTDEAIPDAIITDLVQLPGLFETE